jgi:hypothetical protein
VAEEFVVQAERRADELVARNDREIQHFAGTLRATGGRLAGPQVDAALNDAFGSSWQGGVPGLNHTGSAARS